MTKSLIPQVVKDSLDAPNYRRPEKMVATKALEKICPVSHSLLQEFCEEYEGPFWSEFVGYELLDLVEGKETIVTSTEICRKQFRFPETCCVLTQLSSGQVVVLDAERDKVYEVDFEGGEKRLADASLPARWESFESFLKEYFTGSQ